MKTSYKINLIKMYVSTVLKEYSRLYREEGISSVVKNCISNIINSYKHIPYSYAHSRCYVKVENHLGYGFHHWHDWDKIIMFALVPWLSPDCINTIHVLMQKHHPIYWTKDENTGNWIKKYKDAYSEVDWEQAIVDWECARFTKPDKPLDAYDTYCKYYKGISYDFDKKILSMLDALNLIHWTDRSDTDLVCKTDIMKDFVWK